MQRVLNLYKIVRLFFFVKNDIFNRVKLQLVI